MHVQFMESRFDLSIQHTIEQAGCRLVYVCVCMCVCVCVLHICVCMHVRGVCVCVCVCPCACACVHGGRVGGWVVGRDQQQ